MTPASLGDVPASAGAPPSLPEPQSPVATSQFDPIVTKQSLSPVQAARQAFVPSS